MTINTIDTTTPTIGLKAGADILNNNFTNTAHAASYEVGSGAGQIPRNDDLPTFGTAAEVDTGTGAADVPTNANLSASIAGAATFSGDVYTFSPSGTGFRPLQAGMYLSFRLPSGSANTTATPDISYNGSTYVIKWIDGSALVANDLEQTYNKQPILFYFDGTDMLIASNIGGISGSVFWYKEANGKMEMNGLDSLTTGSSALNLFGTSAGTVYSGDTTITFPKTFSATPRTSLDTYGSVSNLATVGRLATTTGFQPRVWSQSNSTSYDISFTATGRWY